MRISRAIVQTAAGIMLAAGTLASQARPLPDQDAFLREARRHLQTDTTLQSSYVYVETRREQTFDSQWRLKREKVTVIENSPGLPGEPRWERVISRNGVPVPARELEKQDRERQRRAEEMARRAERRPQQERARLERQWEEQRREQAERVEDIFRVYEIRMLRREAIEGHDTIVFSLEPRPDSRPRTREGNVMKRFSVMAWVSESDHELVRLEVEAIDDVSWGLGLLARMHKGTRMSFLRRKVNGEVWLPASVTYKASARVALVRVLRRGGISEFSDYRKYTVGTDEAFAPVEEP